MTARTPTRRSDATGRVSSGGPSGRSASVLLGTQLLFNVGFYAVVPFLALLLTQDFGLAGGAVGLVLGVRTFAQQGMFLVGGVLADRFGARPVILFGCGVRTIGFLALAASLWPDAPMLWLFVAGTVFTGLGGALFSPGLNTLIADADARRVQQGERRRAGLFAWLSVTGEVGAVVGPLLGAILFGWGFAVVAASGAVFFAAIALLLWWVLPAGCPGAREAQRQERGAGMVPAGRFGAREAQRWGTRPGVSPAERCDRGRARPSVAAQGVWASPGDRRFVAFAALHAADLLAYNQLYLTLPLELARVDAAPHLVGLMFAWVSVLTLALQLPIARWAAGVGAPIALRTGYCLSASGFLVVSAGTFLVLPGDARLGVVLLATTLLTLGHLTVNPTALGLVPRFAGTRPTGSYFGLLATLGGVAVLAGNLIAGALTTVAPATGADAAPWTTASPWWFLALPLLIAAIGVPRIVRPVQRGRCR